MLSWRFGTKHVSNLICGSDSAGNNEEKQLDNFEEIRRQQRTRHACRALCYQ